MCLVDRDGSDRTRTRAPESSQPRADVLSEPVEQIGDSVYDCVRALSRGDTLEVD